MFTLRVRTAEETLKKVGLRFVFVFDDQSTNEMSIIKLHSRSFTYGLLSGSAITVGTPDLLVNGSSDCLSAIETKSPVMS